MREPKQIGQELFGLGGYEVYIEASEALHKFARATDCPPGRDVCGWFSEQTQAWQSAVSKERNSLKD